MQEFKIREAVVRIPRSAPVLVEEFLHWRGGEVRHEVIMGSISRKERDEFDKRHSGEYIE